MTKYKNSFVKSCSSNSVFFIENCFHEVLIDFRLRKLTLESKNAPFLTACLQFLVQDIKVSLEFVDFYPKESLILDARVSNSTIPLTLIHAQPDKIYLQYLDSISMYLRFRPIVLFH